jgi:hypothetical protein
MNVIQISPYTGTHQSFHAVVFQVTTQYIDSMLTWNIGMCISDSSVLTNKTTISVLSSTRNLKMLYTYCLSVQSVEYVHSVHSSVEHILHSLMYRQHEKIIPKIW